MAPGKNHTTPIVQRCRGTHLQHEVGVLIFIWRHAGLAHQPVSPVGIRLATPHTDIFCPSAGLLVVTANLLRPSELLPLGLVCYPPPICVDLPRPPLQLTVLGCATCQICRIYAQPLLQASWIDSEALHFAYKPHLPPASASHADPQPARRTLHESCCPPIAAGGCS